MSTNVSMLQLDIKLVGPIIYFVPPVDESFAEKSMHEYFAEWLQWILSRSEALSELVIMAFYFFVPIHPMFF